MGVYVSIGSGRISIGFDSAERRRFHNLLKLAAESPFQGERDAALAAAKRLAARRGMDLREAAAAAADAEPQPEPQPAPQARPGRPSDFWRKTADRPRNGSGFEAPPGFDERWGRAKRDARQDRPDDDKRDWRAAYDAARQRGLDEEDEAPRPKPRATSSRTKSDRRMNPYLHARTLLNETSLPLGEIAQITRLNIYQIVALKLKMRDEPIFRRRARA